MKSDVLVRLKKDHIDLLDKIEHLRVYIDAHDVDDTVKAQYMAMSLYEYFLDLRIRGKDLE